MSAFSASLCGFDFRISAFLESLSSSFEPSDELEDPEDSSEDDDFLLELLDESSSEPQGEGFS